MARPGRESVGEPRRLLPRQRVLGYLPQLPGGLLPANSQPRETPTSPGDDGVARAMAMRKAASQAFFEVDCNRCNQDLKNVTQGGPRPLQDYAVGQMVYFYRLGAGGNKTGQSEAHRWHGPARVIMTDYAGAIWLSFQGGLIKASPERIRPASEEDRVRLA